jgi:hypothetical protein
MARRRSRISGRRGRRGGCGGAGVGEGEVGLALLGEVGVEFEAVADIDDEDEGGRILVGGEGADVAFGLAAGLEHGVVPGGGAAGDAGAAVFLEGRGGRRRSPGAGGGGLAVGALLGFEDEAGAFVEVDAAGGGAVAVEWRR